MGDQFKRRDHVVGIDLGQGSIKYVLEDTLGMPGAVRRFHHPRLAGLFNSGRVSKRLAEDIILGVFQEIFHQRLKVRPSRCKIYVTARVFSPFSVLNALDMIPSHFKCISFVVIPFEMCAVIACGAMNREARASLTGTVVDFGCQEVRIICVAEGRLIEESLQTVPCNKDARNQHSDSTTVGVTQEVSESVLRAILACSRELRWRLSQAVMVFGSEVTAETRQQFQELLNTDWQGRIEHQRRVNQSEASAHAQVLSQKLVDSITVLDAPLEREEAILAGLLVAGDLATKS